MTDRASALILYRKKILLIFRQRDGIEYYVVPGGGVEINETIREACIREVREETGLKVKNLIFVGNINNRGRIEHYFLTHVFPGKAKIGFPESARQKDNNRFTLVWVPINEILTLNIVPSEALKLIEKAITEFQ
jgi:8-oxo-dGTP diphosphatase